MNCFNIEVVQWAPDDDTPGVWIGLATSEDRRRLHELLCGAQTTQRADLLTALKQIATAIEDQEIFSDVPGVFKDCRSIACAAIAKAESADGKAPAKEASAEGEARSEPNPTQGGDRKR